MKPSENNKNPFRICVFHAKGLFSALILCVVFFQCNGQSICSGSVPQLTANLSSSPTASWISSSVVRSGLCCAASNPDRCLQFSVTLHPDAAGIIFNIASGAVPPGALYYQINCGTPTQVGSAICLSGTGPHILTFCKPGNNPNQYSITSVPKASVVDTVRTSYLCTKKIGTRGFITSTLTWRSVFPGTSGQYNSALSCTSNCDTAIFTATKGLPQEIRYEVCGMMQSGCLTTTVCDTVTVLIAPELNAATTPVSPIICFGDSGVQLNVSLSGGVPPYQVLWNTGSTALSAFASSAGKYAVRVTDSTGCVIVSDSVNVIANPKLNANAGRDTSVCKGSRFILGASPTASGGNSPYSYQWTATGDTLSNNSVANPQASPHLNSSYFLTVTDNRGCKAFDTMHIVVGTCNVVCNGATGPNILGAMGTFSEPYIVPNNTTSALCIRNGTPQAPLNNIGMPKPNQTTYVYAQTSGGLGPEGRYTFVKTLGDGATANCLHNDFRGRDRTGDGGYFMAINGSPNQSLFGGTFFKLDSIPVCPNTDYEFSAWLSNLKTGMQSHPANSFPNVAFFINNVIVAYSGPVGPTTGQWFNDWVKAGGIWNSGSEPYANIRIDNYTFVASGNDLALDDIHFKVCGPVIVSQTSRTLYCEGDEVIIRDSVACTNGQLYSWFRWQRSLDGGVTWTNVSGVQSSNSNAFYPVTLGPFTATAGLNNSMYRLMVALDSNSLASANPNCIILGNATTIRVGTPPAVQMNVADTICHGIETVLSPLISGGTTPYYFEWKNLQTTATSNQPTYQFTINQSTRIVLNVSDTAGCVATDTMHFEPAPILNFNKNVQHVLCHGAASGSIHIELNNLASPYSFSWSDGNVSNPRSALAAGSYVVTITNRFGCTVADTSTINQPAAITVSETIQHVGCAADNSGAITINASGGIPSYTYTWSNGATGNNLQNLSGGVYSVTVRDAVSCTVTSAFTVNESDSVIASVNAVNATCFGVANGSATLSVSGGTTPYQFAWNNGNTSNTIQNVAAGNYSATITDSKGCTKTITTEITSPATLQISIIKTDANCFAETGKAKAFVTGGTAPFIFAWSNGSSIDSISNVAAGSYSLTVTDFNGCSATANVSITQPDSLALAGIAVTNVLCFGNNSGSIAINDVAGGTAPYTFAWSNGASTQNISNLIAGSYSLTITDSKGCSVVRSFIITQPNAALSVSGSATNVSCFNQNNGSIQLNVSGGTAAYSYTWSNGASTQNLNNLSAGSYAVTVRDANNCSVVQSFTITQPNQLALSINKTDANCFAETGKAKAFVTGGTAPFIFAWSNGSSIDSISNVAAGSYSLTVTDFNGCSATANVSITQPDSLALAGIAVTNVLCFGNNSGSIAINDVAGGTAPYTFAWSNGASTQNISNLIAGSYSLTITDSKGCSVVRSFIITQPNAALSVSGSATNVSCFNQNNGSIQLNVSGGTAAYSYTWSNGASTQNLNNLSAGSYAVTVRDANNCSVVQSFTITQPNQLALSINKTDANCFAETGKAKAFVTGGTAPFIFAWSNGSSIDSISNVAAGSYSLTVTDFNGCSATANVSITQPDSLALAGIAVTNVLCFGNNSGSIAINDVAGGTAPYTFAWSNGASTQNISNLIAGSYSLTITDSKGCSVVRSFIITQPNAALSVSGSATNVSCFNQNNGSIQLNVSGGTAAYSYTWSNGASTQNLNNLSAGSYAVTVRDANNCSVVQSFTITQPNQLALSINKTDANCFAETGKAKAFVTGGTAPFIFAWSNGSSIDSISNVAAGSYSLTVTDFNGCSATANVSITQPDSLALAGIAVTNVLCFGNNSGSIAINDVAGGTAPYTFAWSNGASTQNISNLIAGNYLLTVTDSKGCSTSRSFIITQPNAALSVSGSATNVSCFNQNNGSIQLNVSSGTAAYSYTWSNGASTQNLNNLAAGSYAVTVRDANNCSVVQSFTITQPNQLALSINKTDANCFAETGKAKATVTGGTAPFIFAWSNGSSIDSISNVAAGNYSVTVTDFNGCSATANVSITQPDSLALAGIAVTNVLCFGNNSGSIAINDVAGGTAPYTFAWSNGASTQNISNLIAGSYSLTITDSKGCSVVRSFIVTQPNAALSVSGSATNVSCFNQNNGSIQLNVSGGTAAYSYTWSNGASTQNLNNLSAGSYAVTVRDANNCSVVQSFTITQPNQLALSINKTDANCFAETGRAKAIVTGGTAPFIFAWSNGSSIDSISNVAAGNYSVTVTDFNGCSATANVSITQPDSLALAGIAVTNVLCFGNNSGSISINSVAGGTAPYTFAWSNGASTQNISNLIAGSYSLTITDSKGCSVVRSFIITQPNAALSVSGSATNVSCFNQNNGSIQLNVSGGTAAYSYTWSNGASTQNLNNLSAGSYAVTVRDANNCSVVQSFTITQPNQLALSINKTDANCFAETGKAKAFVTGGTAPFIFAWSNGSSIDSISNVAAGSYSLTVTDFNGCSATANVSITQPDSLALAGIAVTNVLCFGNNSGSISINSVAGGTAPYTFAWSNGASTQNISNLIAGNYLLTVTDSKGCSTSRSFIITQPNAALSVSGTTKNLACHNIPDGAIQLNVVGGTLPHTFSWSNGSTNKHQHGLAAGNFNVTTTDANGCSVISSFPILQPDSFSVTANIAAVLCHGDATGKIQLTVSGATAPYAYEWSNQSSNAQIQDLISGNYSVTVADSKNCTAVRTYNVSQPVASLSATSNATHVSCNNGSNGSIQINAAGGTSPYQFLWSNGQTTSTAQQLSAGFYQATITDANSCSTTISATLTHPDSLKLQANISNASCNGSNNGSIDLQPIGGTAPYMYNWSNGQVSQDINQLSPGNYSVQVADSKGCYATAAYTLTDPQPLTWNGNPFVEHVDCYNANTGGIMVQVQGGNPPYTYQWSNGQNTASIQNIPAGNYSLTVTDAQQCTLMLNQHITQPSAVHVNMFKTDETCNNRQDGTAQATASGGAPPYRFFWNNGSANAGIANLAAGAYTVTVVDANSCSAVNSVTIQSPDSIKLSSSIKPISCYGKSDGEISIQVSGGTSPYQYQWSTGASTTQIKNLQAGVYSAVVTDAKGCSALGSFTVKQPDPIQIALSKTDVTCNSKNNGTINLNVNGGIPPYAYLWSNNETTTTINNLATGNYTVTVSDASQCSKADSAIIYEPSPIIVSAMIENAKCFGEASGNVFTNVSGGVSPYNYFWNTGTAQKDLLNVAAATYQLTVSDNNGCTRIAQATVAQPQPIQVQFSVQHNKCFGSSDGEVTANVTGGNLPYQYAWNNGSNKPSIKNVISGDYVLDIKDVMGCTATNVAKVNQPDELKASISTKGVSCLNQNSGMATVAASGGNAPYHYLWMNGATSNSINGLAANTLVSVVVKDANGCEAFVQDTIKEIPAMDLDAMVQHLTCRQNSLGSISLIVEHGVSPYQYAWSSGQKSSSIAVNSAGNYSVTVTDRNGCTVTGNYTITSDTGFSISTINAQTIKLGEIVELTTTTTSNDIRLWMWTPANFDAGLSCSNCQNPDAQPKKTTTYLVKAIDNKGCEATDTVTISVTTDHTIFIPNMFSPNGDGVNDVFEVYGNYDGIKEYDIKIFNRWGEKVFESSDPRSRWDGTYKNVLQDPGVFVYYMKVIFLDGWKPDDDGKGSFTLVR